MRGRSDGFKLMLERRLRLENGYLSLLVSASRGIL